jgi:hypothetical protein
MQFFPHNTPTLYRVIKNVCNWMLIQFYSQQIIITILIQFYLHQKWSFFLFRLLGSFNLRMTYIVGMCLEVSRSNWEKNSQSLFKQMFQSRASGCFWQLFCFTHQGHVKWDWYNTGLNGRWVSPFTGYKSTAGVHEFELHIHIYIYIYIYRERERERGFQSDYVAIVFTTQITSPTIILCESCTREEYVSRSENKKIPKKH